MAGPSGPSNHITQHRGADCRANRPAQQGHAEDVIPERIRNGRADGDGGVEPTEGEGVKSPSIAPTLSPSRAPTKNECELFDQYLFTITLQSIWADSPYIISTIAT